MQRMGCKFANLNKVKFADRFHSYFILIHPSIAIHSPISVHRSRMQIRPRLCRWQLLSPFPATTKRRALHLISEFANNSQMEEIRFYYFFLLFMANCLSNWICNCTSSSHFLAYVRYIRVPILCWHIMIATRQHTNVVVCLSFPRNRCCRPRIMIHFLFEKVDFDRDWNAIILLLDIDYGGWR